MRANSLALRLIASASLWSAVALIAAGVILISLYRQTVENAFDERLSVYQRTLIGALAAQNPDQPLADPGNLGEARFELLFSGWYWQVREADGGPVVLSSLSLFSDTLDIDHATGVHETPDGFAGALTGPDDRALRVLTRTVTLPGERRFDVLVAGDAGGLRNQVAAFRNSVILTLAVFGIGLILATLFQIRWGLRPLDQVRRGLANLRSGQKARFEGDFPAEIDPLIKELNALLESNQEIIERARTQVGNLAHALKTPLSVVINEARAGRGPLAGKVVEQAELMRQQINHYLDRARIAARVEVIGAVTDVEPVVGRLARAMTRIHGNRGIRLTWGVAEGAKFRGEQQDLEEILGNLVDNACKWAKSHVSVAVENDTPPGASGRLTILIDDDGPGLPEKQREEATRRGRRLDETKPGSGLGLSIVTDLVAMYQGSFRLNRSPENGLRAEIELPAA